MMDNRPNPQELLNKIQEDNDKSEKGRLKIFLGFAAGVGKTYSMLKAATELAKDGEDVVIGYIETHGRRETEALLPENVEYIPLNLIEYKDTILKEFDLDRTLKRKPKIVILDELAHSNAYSCRNSKRYQDVLELLNAGISVFTALNIQHIESLNNIVEQITGISVQETVPDNIIEEADEVMLIDLPPEELIERLNEGKIYPEEVAKKALTNFFRKGNLTALREIALRKTAQKVDQQILEYRSAKEIDDLWASNDKLLTIIEPGYSSEKIIRSAKKIFDRGFSSWIVAYIESPSFLSKSMRDKQKTLDLLDLAKQLGATPLKLVGSDPALAIVDFVQENNINTLMLSQYRLPLYYKLFGKSLAERISELMPEIHIHLVSEDNIQSRQAYTKPKRKLNYLKITKKLIYFGIIFFTFGFIIHPLNKLFTSESILVMYILVTMLVSRGRGKISALIPALMATLSFDFFFIEPIYSFAANDRAYIITFVIMTLVGLTFNLTNGNLRYQVSQLENIQNQAELLQEASNELATTIAEKQILEVIPSYFSRIFNAKYMLLLPDLEENLSLRSGEAFANFDENIAKWVFANNQTAGLNTNTFARSTLVYLPVLSSIRARGILIIKPNDEIAFFMPDIQHLLNSFCSQLATTLERIHFTQIAMQTEVAIAKQKASTTKM